MTGLVSAHRLRVVEALGWLVLAGLLRRLVPMRRWSGLLGPSGPAAVDPLAASTRQPLSGAEQRVAGAVLRAAPRLRANCLEQALAGAVMLRLRGARSATVIGLDLADPESAPHAWLVGASGSVLTGRDAGHGHRPASQFGSI